jgi:hypothetical protein
MVTWPHDQRLTGRQVCGQIAARFVVIWTAVRHAQPDTEWLCGGRDRATGPHRVCRMWTCLVPDRVKVLAGLVQQGDRPSRRMPLPTGVSRS